MRDKKRTPPIKQSRIPFALINKAVDKDSAGETKNKEKVKTKPNSIKPIPPMENGMFMIKRMTGTATRQVVKSISELKAILLTHTFTTARS